MTRETVEKALAGELKRGELLKIAPGDFAAAAGEMLDVADRGLRMFSFLTQDKELSKVAREDANALRAMCERWAKP